MLRLVLLFACVPSLARAQCELRGTLSHSALQVSAGSDTIRVRVREAPVRVQPTRDRAQVHVDAALRFTATASELPYFIRSRVETGHGMLSLTSSIPIDHVRSSNGALTASVQLNPFVRIRRLRFDCDALVLGREQIEEAPALEPSSPSVGHLLRPARRVLSMHAAPRDDAPAVRIRLDRDAPFMLDRVRARNGWLEVEWTDGSNRLRGWVRREHVRPSHHHGWGSTGGHGTPGCMPRGTAHVPGGYEGPAEIIEGTEVLYAPGGARWATVGSGRFVVRWAPNDEYAAVIEASGVSVGDSCGLEHAFVRRDAVTRRPTSG